MIRNFTQICNCYSVVNFHFLIGFFKPGYRINQSYVVRKGLSWFIFVKKRQFLTFFWFPQISYCLPSWLYTSAKYEICKSCVHYTMGSCVCLWTGLVYFQGFTPEFGGLPIISTLQYLFWTNSSTCPPHNFCLSKQNFSFFHLFIIINSLFKPCLIFDCSNKIHNPLFSLIQKGYTL